MRKTILSVLAAAFLITIYYLPITEFANVAFHQKFIEGEKQELQETSLDISDTDQVFEYVFSALDPEVVVYPSENYYYFIFKANDREYWGNIRLAVKERNLGILNFVYWESNPSTPRPETHYKKYGPGEGAVIRKINDFRYSIGYRGKEAIFNLNQIDQQPPKLAKLESGEVFAQKTFDESGFSFFLIFNKRDPHFMFVLDEEKKLPDRLISFNEELAVGERSDYAFYADNKNNRKILIGVGSENINRNNYYDGPFDQLADNYINGPEFKNYLEAVYPDLRGKINNYGHYLEAKDARVAITPYYIYSEPEWLYDIIKRCREFYSGSKFYSCISHDQKEEF